MDVTEVLVKLTEAQALVAAIVGGLLVVALELSIWHWLRAPLAGGVADGAPKGSDVSPEDADKVRCELCDACISYEKGEVFDELCESCFEEYWRDKKQLAEMKLRMAEDIGDTEGAEGMRAWLTDIEAKL